MGTDGEQGQKLGPTGRRVAENLKQVRGPIPVRELAARMVKLGRPILASAVTKMEQGSRRIDADDLVALAAALDVTPNRLLLTEAASNVDMLALTEHVKAPTAVAWRWASGERPLTGLDVASETTAGLARERRAGFTSSNRPHHPSAAVSLSDKVTHREAVEPAVRATLDAIEATGLTKAQVLAYIEEEVTLERFGGPQHREIVGDVKAAQLRYEEGGDDGQR